MTSELFEKGIDAYQKIFWPEFVEYEDCIFLSFDEAKYRQWLQVMSGDKQKIESIMNHRHIVDLLPQSVESPTRSLVVRFGELLRDLWNSKLHRDYPKRRFNVSFEFGESETFDDYEITFYQTTAKS